MAYEITYGTHDYRVEDHKEVPAFLDDVTEALKNEAGGWVKVPGSEDHQILVTPGVTVSVRLIPTSYVYGI